MRRFRGCVAMGSCWLLLVGAGCSDDETGSGPAREGEGEGEGEGDAPLEGDWPFHAGVVPDPRAAFAAPAESPLDLAPNAAGYTLPLDVGRVANLQRDIVDTGILAAAGEADSPARQLLAANGFVVAPTGQRRFRRFSEAFQFLEQREVPIFVTADSTLHLFHLFYDQILKYLEVTEFSTGMRELLHALVEVSEEQRAAYEGVVAEAARRNLAFLAVATRLLDPEFPLPEGVPEAEAELALIEAHQALAASPLMNAECPADCDPCSPAPGPCRNAGTCLCEDYTQYVPRGHYTVSEALQRYFRALMWIGRIGFRVRSDTETRQAVLLADALNRAQVGEGAARQSAAAVWYRIYDVTSFLIGGSDDLTFYEYNTAVAGAFGDGFNLAELARAGGLARLRAELARLRNPAILGGYELAVHDETERTKGLRLMGQRFAPDSYVLGRMVFDHVSPDPTHPEAGALLAGCGADADATCDALAGQTELISCVCDAANGIDHPEVCRFLPSGLDVMAVLGSDRARALLEPEQRYCGFAATLDELSAEFAAYGRADWQQSAYWAWLDVLTPLLTGFPAGYPNVVRTDAWATRLLNTALGSWAELRHDTILYVKQSYTPAAEGEGEPPGYESYGAVEPAPRFFARLADLTAYTRAGLADHDALPEGLAEVMGDVETLLARLAAIAVAQLEGRAPSAEDIRTVRNMGATFNHIVSRLADVVRVEEEVPPECAHGGCMEQDEIEGDPYEVRLVADVHTDVNTESVLEEGLGYLEWLVVARSMPDGSIGAGVGPVFTWHEFPHPMRDRLTDERWRELLDDGQAPGRPAWMLPLRAEP